MKFCTYLTIYSGSKLPPFYIGSTTIDRILIKGYKGSVSSEEYHLIWKSELKNNPQMFKTKILTMHATRKDAFIKERFFQKSLQVVKSPLYINKTYAGDKFHMSGEKHSPETKIKMSLSQTGRKHSEETKQQISAKHKGKKFSEESKAKMAAYASNRPLEHIAKIGKASKNRSEQTLKALSSYASNRTAEHKLKLSAALTGIKWTEEQKNKLSASRKGKPKSAAWKESKRLNDIRRREAREALAQSNLIASQC